MKYNCFDIAIAALIWTSGCGTSPSESPKCTPHEAVSCSGDTLVRCDAEGSGTVSQTCPLGCRIAAPQCADPIPSNGLERFVQLSANRADLYLGESAQINTDTGDVVVGGSPAVVDTEVVTQSGGPTIRVFVVRSLTAKKVVVSGTNALAFVSAGDILIDGTIDLSAKGTAPGPGSFTEETCVGKVPPIGHNGGAGGGGFGTNGGAGGTVDGDQGLPGPSGKRAGTDSLSPLRGGCEGGWGASSRAPGAGGGAIQLVSGTQIVVRGTLAAHGGGGAGGGGSGGGILLEAPVVHVSGKVVANGGGGGGCEPGSDGTADGGGTGGNGCASFNQGSLARGGAGAGANSEGNAGGSQTIIYRFPGNGGGGAGRIRINTAPVGLNAAGTFSPNPSLGTLAANF